MFAYVHLNVHNYTVIPSSQGCYKYLSGSAFALICLSKYWDGFPLGLGLVVKDKPFVYIYTY